MDSFLFAKVKKLVPTPGFEPTYLGFTVTHSIHYAIKVETEPKWIKSLIFLKKFLSFLIFLFLWFMRMLNEMMMMMMMISFISECLDPRPRTKNRGVRAARKSGWEETSFPMPTTEMPLLDKTTCSNGPTSSSTFLQVSTVAQQHPLFPPPQI